MFLQSKLIQALVLTLTIITVYAEVTPPNYLFTLAQLKPFHPGKPVADIVKQFPNHSIVRDDGTIKLYQFSVTYTRYKFPVLVQSSGAKVLDMFARLPTYFLHDIFHQSLIELYGKQEHYHRQERDAVYIWKNEDGNRHVYSGSCSITCFPNYYAIIATTPPTNSGPAYLPLIEQFKIKPLP